MLGYPVLAFMDIGGGEFVVIVVVALMLYGGRLPEVARNVGRTVGELKRVADRLSREFREGMDTEDYQSPFQRQARTTRPKPPPHLNQSGEDRPEAKAARLAYDPTAVPEDEGAPSEEARRQSPTPIDPASPGSSTTYDVGTPDPAESGGGSSPNNPPSESP